MKMMPFCLAASLFLTLLRPAMADPTPSLDNLNVVDQGRVVTVTWHFYYELLPAKFTLHEPNSQYIVLNDPPALKQNLVKLASAAFILTLDGQPAPLQRVDELTIAPDRGVLVRLTYPGRPGARVRLQDVLLSTYPASYVINYQIYSPIDSWRGASGYFTGGAVASADYVQVAKDFKPSPLDWLGASPIVLFKSTLRTAWIDTNWLFLALLVLLTRPFGEAYSLAWIMGGVWSLPCFFWTVDDLQIPINLHPLIPALGTAAICLLCLRFRPQFKPLAWAVGFAGLVDSCFDIQQTSLERPFPSMANFAGLCFGFLAGLALIFAIGFPIIAECRKSRDFQSAWAPKICWATAALALVLPWVKT